ncbi:HAD-IIB family hydrolase [Puteibacter caeruleilacunae]|nr:HAD-IIB family hydrolase [Puteibacter caeruleilacunae]
MEKLRMLITDLDGTLLKDDKSISDKDITALNNLGERGIVRVVATGRNLQKVRAVLNPNTPIDYVVFSSGAGIYNWREELLMAKENLSEGKTLELISFLEDEDINFFVFNPVPDNAKMRYYQGDQKCEEFERYLNANIHNAEPLNNVNRNRQGAAQFMVVLPNDDKLYESLEGEILSKVEGIRIIRSTSQIDDDFIWMEIFNETVSKGHGIAHLCQETGILQSETMGIGNDYNDIDMLEFTQVSYITGNAPDALKCNGYEITETNENSGVSVAITKSFP